MSHLSILQSTGAEWYCYAYLLSTVWNTLQTLTKSCFNMFCPHLILVANVHHACLSGTDLPKKFIFSTTLSVNKFGIKSRNNIRTDIITHFVAFFLTTIHRNITDGIINLFYFSQRCTENNRSAHGSIFCQYSPTKIIDWIRIRFLKSSYFGVIGGSLGSKPI